MNTLKSNLTLTFLCLIAAYSFSQSSILFRNNSWLDFEVELTQQGTHILDADEWTQTEFSQDRWIVDTELMSTQRDSGIVPLGDTAYFDLKLKHSGESISLQLRLLGTGTGSRLHFSASGPGFDDPWVDGGGFYQNTTTLAGKSLIVKYRAENADNNLSRDILFAVHELPAYHISEFDFNHPSTINVMAWNIQMLPFGITGMPDAALRAAEIPSHISPHQDVVIFNEIFDPSPREDHLQPAMEAAGFLYHTQILNDFLPFNGGVIMYSRWPIETTAEYDFALCGPNAADCLANKGILYAAINKMGKRYHLFGTHMDAGNGDLDIEARASQYGEMRDFIAAQNIPQHEPVIYGGDFNTSPLDDMFSWMMDSLNPMLPYPIGYHSSTMSSDTGNIIDHIWAHPENLMPLNASNQLVTIRTVEDNLWDLVELSDHRTVIGRFAYPNISVIGEDATICPGDNMNFSINANLTLDYQWYINGIPVNGATGDSYYVYNATSAHAGLYECETGYSLTLGNAFDPVTKLFYPNGPVIWESNMLLHVSQLETNCGVGVENELLSQIRVFPNPSDGVFQLSSHSIPGLLTISVSNCQGAVIYRNESAQAGDSFDLRTATPGLYFVQLRAEGKTTTSKLLLK